MKTLADICYAVGELYALHGSMPKRIRVTRTFMRSVSEPALIESSGYRILCTWYGNITLVWDEQAEPLINRSDFHKGSL